MAEEGPWGHNWPIANHPPNASTLLIGVFVMSMHSSLDFPRIPFGFDVVGFGRLDVPLSSGLLARDPLRVRWGDFAETAAVKICTSRRPKADKPT